MLNKILRVYFYIITKQSKSTLHLFCIKNKILFNFLRIFRNWSKKKFEQSLIFSIDLGLIKFYLFFLSSLAWSNFFLTLTFYFFHPLDSRDIFHDSKKKKIFSSLMVFNSEVDFSFFSSSFFSSFKFYFFTQLFFFSLFQPM